MSINKVLFKVKMLEYLNQRLYPTGDYDLEGIEKDLPMFKGAFKFQYDIKQFIDLIKSL